MTRAQMSARAKRHGWVVIYSAKGETWLQRKATVILIADDWLYRGIEIRKV